MKKNIFINLILLLCACLGILTACQMIPAQATQEPTPIPTSPWNISQKRNAETGEDVRIIKIGFTVSLSGSLVQESTQQKNGFLLWMDQVNALGGIKLLDGTTAILEPIFYDDKSAPEEVRKLYTRLIQEDGVDLLLSPYSSTLANIAAEIADRHKKILITAGAASDAPHRNKYTHVFQVYTPANRYLLGTLDILSTQAPEATRIALLYENDEFSSGVMRGLREAAQEKNYQIVFDQSYPSGTSDFGSYLTELAQTQADALLGGGHYQDGTALTTQIHQRGLTQGANALKFITLLVAPADPGFGSISELPAEENPAKGIVGISQWESELRYKPDFGVNSDQFIQDYQAAYRQEPSYQAAGGYAAGLVMQKTLQNADGIESPYLRSVLQKMDLNTFFGNIRFSANPDSFGMQIGHHMVYVQWQTEDGTQLVKKVIWPEEAQTAPLQFPIR